MGGNLDTFSGDRSYTGLDAFVKSMLDDEENGCSPENTDSCSKKDKKNMKMYLEKSAEDLASDLKKLETKFNKKKKSYEQKRERIVVAMKTMHAELEKAEKSNDDGKIEAAEAKKVDLENEDIQLQRE